MRALARACSSRSPNAPPTASWWRLLASRSSCCELARLAAETKDLAAPSVAGPGGFASAPGFRVTLTTSSSSTAPCLCGRRAGRPRVARSRFGRPWRAVRDDPQAAALCGVDVRARFHARGAAGALFAGLAGVMAALYFGNISFGTGLVFGLKILLCGGRRLSLAARAAAGPPASASPSCLVRLLPDRMARRLDVRLARRFCLCCAAPASRRPRRTIPAPGRSALHRRPFPHQLAIDARVDAPFDGFIPMRLAATCRDGNRRGRSGGTHGGLLAVAGS